MERDFFAEYDPRAFPPVAVTVDMAVFTIRGEVLQVLLVKRGGEPFRGAWALPGGFVRPDEDLDAAAARELKEETGMTWRSAYLEQLASYGAPDRDPRMRVVAVVYWAICHDPPPPAAGSDAREAEWTAVSRVEGGELDLAFDHREVLLDALERMRDQIESPGIAARFCAPQFTISELRQVYEAVWETTLDKGNFQRVVRASESFLYLGTAGGVSGPGGGRPASLWTVRTPDDEPGAFLAEESGLSVNAEGLFDSREPVPMRGPPSEVAERRKLKRRGRRVRPPRK